MSIAPFQFRTTPTIVFGEGEASRLAGHAGALLGPRILVVTDPGVAGLGLPDEALKGLAREASVVVHDDVGPDPDVGMVERALARADELGATGVVGFGGGSPLDVAKTVALLAGSRASLDECWGVNRARGPRLPLVLVPTTAGTGSEVTPVAILTLGGPSGNGAGDPGRDEADTSGVEKRGISSPLLPPDLAVLDPTLTYGLPAHTTAATGIDAMVHAIEAYASKSPNNNPISRAMAREALALLAQNIELAHAGRREARASMLLGSMMAGQAFGNSPVAAVHALAYPLGGRFKVAHGLSNAVLLPHVLAFNAEEPCAMRAYDELAPLVGARGADGFIDRLVNLSQSVGLGLGMAELGVREDDLDQMADDAMLQTRLLVNNPRDVSRADARAIYASAL